MLLAWLGPWHVEGTTARRLGIVLVASLIWDVLVVLDGESSIVHPTPFGVVAAVIGFPLLVWWLVAGFLKAEDGRSGRRWSSSVLQVARPLFILLAGFVLSQVPLETNPHAPILRDATPSVICAARNVLDDSNPYHTPELMCLHDLGVPLALATPLRAGPFRTQAAVPTLAEARRVEAASRHNNYRTDAFPTFGYPPMSFVWMLPVARLERGAWAGWTLVWAAAWLILSLRLARRWWPAVGSILLLQWATGGVLGEASQGDAEFFAVACLAVALMMLDKPHWSGFAMGLAVAGNQLAWVVLPAYVLLAVTLPHARVRLGWMVATIGLLVGPWLVVYPGALHAMLALVTQPAYPLGIGLVALSVVVPVLPLLSQHVYTLAVVGAEVVVIGATAWVRSLTPLAPVLACAVLWLSWRSATNYLGQVPLLACAIAIGLDRITQQGPLVGPLRAVGPDAWRPSSCPPEASV